MSAGGTKAGAATVVTVAAALHPITQVQQQIAHVIALIIG